MTDSIDTSFCVYDKVTKKVISSGVCLTDFLEKQVKYPGHAVAPIEREHNCYVDDTTEPKMAPMSEIGLLTEYECVDEVATIPQVDFPATVTIEGIKYENDNTPLQIKMGMNGRYPILIEPVSGKYFSGRFTLVNNSSAF